MCKKCLTCQDSDYNTQTQKVFLFLIYVWMENNERNRETNSEIYQYEISNIIISKMFGDARF